MMTEFRRGIKFEKKSNLELYTKPAIETFYIIDDNRINGTAPE